MSAIKTMALGSTLILSACSGAQLTYNTVDAATTVQSLYTQQALNNLSRVIDEPYALPSQMDIQTGTITTANGVTPSISFPFTDTIAKTATVAAALSSARTTTSAGSGATLGATQTWQQNWNVLPLSDANTLRNLRALYRFVVYNTDLKSEYLVSRIENGGKLSTDPYLLQYPQCVICTDKRIVNNRLQSGWLYWTNEGTSSVTERKPPENVETINLGHFGNHDLFMTREASLKGYLSDFILFTLPNAEPSSGGAAAVKNGAPNNGRAPAPPGRPNYGFPAAPVPPI